MGEASALSLAQIRKAFEALDSEEIPNSFKGYVSHLAEKITRRKVALSAENSLSSLIPVDLLIAAEPKIQNAMNVRSLELDKMRIQELEETRVQIKPITQELVSSIVLVPGKVKLPERKKNRKRKRRGTKAEEGDAPRKKRRRKTKTEV